MRLSLLLGCVVAAGAAFGQQYPFLAVPGSPTHPGGLFQDSKGRSWLFSDTDELACFDGARFFFLRDYGFPSVKSYDVTEDLSGGIWIGAQTGVYRFADGKVEQVSRGVATSVIAVTDQMAVAAEGLLAIGPFQDKELVRIRRRGGAWTSEPVMNLHSPEPITLDHSGMLLYSQTQTQWGEIRLQDIVHWRAGTRLATISHGPPGGHPLAIWSRVMRDDSGCVWIGSHSGIAYDCGAGHPTLVPGAVGDIRMHQMSDGRVLLTGNSLLAIGRPGSFQIATRANGMPAIIDAVQARDGTIWLAGTDGLYRFPSPFRIEYWTIREGLLDPPWSITRVGPRIYAGLEHKIAVLSRDHTRWNIVAQVDGGGSVGGLLASGLGTLLATFTNGVAELRTDGKVIARTEPGRPEAPIRLARTPDGEIWVGGGEFGTISREQHILRFNRHPLLTHPSFNVLAIRYEDRTRRLWACYSGGLIRRDQQGLWREFTTKDGLRVNDCWSVAPLPNGDAWYAYRNFPGIAHVRPDGGEGIKVHNYDRTDMVEPGGDTLDADHEGRLWRGGDLGIYVASPSEAEAAKWLRLDRSDGLPANGMNSGSVFVDTDGSLWWGADNDLAHYVPPPDLVSPTFAPQVFVSSFSWEGQAPKLAETVQSVPHGAKITAHIGSLQFERRNALRVRYRMSPDQAWRETTNLDVALGALRRGEHTLEVQGRVFSGPWSGTVRSALNVLPSVWVSNPYLACYFAISIALASGGYFLRRRWRVDEAQLLPDLTSWRLGALTPEIQGITGTVLDSRFSVGNLLARGGFANVMDGRDQLRAERCAIKIFRTEVKNKVWIQRGFEQEIAALQKVRHRNVIHINTFGRTPAGAPYLVMEFVEGRNLREVLADGPLAPARIARLLGQLADALDAIHAEGICHRDLKPENLLLRNENTAEEEPVLIDFSIAIIKDADETLHGLSRAAGTFDYMAPEQAIGHAQASSDVYSLARVLIEMLTGRQLRDLLPGAALDLPERVTVLLRGLRLPLSEEAIKLIASALEFDPMRRPSSASAFAATIVRDLPLKSATEAF